jgi:hypothetical protein
MLRPRKAVYHGDMTLPLRSGCATAPFNGLPARRRSLHLVHQLSRTPAPCGRLPTVRLLTELDAFFSDHRVCGDLDAGVEGPIVRIACDWRPYPPPC